MLKSEKNGYSRERHLALCTNLEKNVENFSTEGRAPSIVTSYIEKQNACKQDVDGDSVEGNFLISIDNISLNILTGFSGSRHEVHLKKRLF